jgi:hypothetical protein
LSSFSVRLLLALILLYPGFGTPNIWYGALEKGMGTVTSMNLGVGVLGRFHMSQLCTITITSTITITITVTVAVIIMVMVTVTVTVTRHCRHHCQQSRHYQSQLSTVHCPQSTVNCQLSINILFSFSCAPPPPPPHKHTLTQSQQLSPSTICIWGEGGRAEKGLI